MNRRRILIAHVAGIGIASAIAQVLAKEAAGTEIEIMTEEEHLDDLLFGPGAPGVEPLGLSRVIEAKPVAMADTREFIPLRRPDKDPNRFRPKDLYHQRKQGWKPRQ